MQTVINGILTNYEVINPTAKSTVLILHGWGSNSSYWLPLAKLLSPKYRYYLLDLPGFGGTRNLSPNSDIPEYTQFVKDFADKLRLKNFLLVGHSFGGQIAADFAIKHGHQLKKLILIDAAVIRTRGPKTWVKIGLTKIIKPLVSLFPTHVTNSILRLYAGDYARSNDYQKRVLHQILKYNLGLKLHLIKVPTEIIWGSEDRVIPYTGKHLVETIPDARLYIIYGSGHLPHLTHPTKLAAVLNKILND